MKVKTRIIIVKVKSKIVLMIYKLSTATYRGVDVQTHVFLTSTLLGVEWLVSRPGRFSSYERTSDIHWIGGWVGLSFGLDDMEKRKSLHYRESNQSRPPNRCTN
jgi:hypothetical protein